MNTFASLNLNSKLHKGLTACGHVTPTDIQWQTIPHILAGLDIIGTAETGSGKTAAFVLPALNKVTESKATMKPRVLIITPTRELADQITTCINKLGKFLKLNVAKLIGGASYKQQDLMLSRPLDIVVATPGRLLDYVKRKRLDLSAIEMFVLDEADRMLDMGFIMDIKQIAKYLPPNRQTLLFSATTDMKLINSIGYLLNNPVAVNLSRATLIPDKINQQIFIAANPQQKIHFLETLLTEESIFKGIIFAATKIGADKIAGHLRSQGHSALALHGDLKQRVRKKSLEQLSAGKIQYLVATDIASRGIDVQNISHVINYDLPRCSEDYVHRIGRTGRAGKAGTAITIALENEKHYIYSIEKKVGSQLQVINMNREPTCRTQLETKNSFPKKKSNSKKRRRYSQDTRKPEKKVKNKSSF